MSLINKHSASVISSCQKRSFRILALLFLLITTINAQANYTVISSSVIGRKAISDCVDQIYKFNFMKAESLTKQLAQQYPAHPAVSLLSATNKYWQWYPARGNKQLEEQIRGLLNEASNNSSKWLDGSGRDVPEAMFVYFSAEALLARMDNFQHATMASVGHAKNAYPYIKKSFDLQKTYPDFLLVAGLFNYYREEYVQIKPFYKTFVWFMQDGDKTEGLKQLKMASQTSMFCKAEAGIYLAHILTDYEKNPNEALPDLFSLSESYPNNLYIQGKLAEVLLSAGKPAKALVYIQNLMVSNVTGYKDLALANRARYNLLTSNLSQATNDANQILDAKVKDEHLLALAHQVLAAVDSKQGRVSQAKLHYKKVKEFSEYPILTDEADNYIRNH